MEFPDHRKLSNFFGICPYGLSKGRLGKIGHFNYEDGNLTPWQGLLWSLYLVGQRFYLEIPKAGAVPPAPAFRFYFFLSMNWASTTFSFDMFL